MTASAHLSESLEDYLEAIFHIAAAKKAARAKDISDRLGVTRASVTGALRVLAEKSLVNYSPYDLVTLTSAGAKAARNVVQRHEALHDFFVTVLGVEELEAERSACRMEHALSPPLLARVAQFVKYVKQKPQLLSGWKRTFKAAGSAAVRASAP